MQILKEQGQASRYRGLPVDNVGASQSIETITAETVQLYYYNSGVQTADAGQAAGVVVVGQLANASVKNELGSMCATARDTSLSFTSTALTNEVNFPFTTAEALDSIDASTRATEITKGFSNGDYCVDYVNGTIYGVKASTQTSLTSTTYKIQKEVTGGSGGGAQDVIVQPGTDFDTGTVSITTAGVPQQITATSTPILAVAIQGHRNNTGYVLVGNASNQLWELEAGQSIVIPIDNLNKVYLDVTVSGEDANYMIIEE